MSGNPIVLVTLSANPNSISAEGTAVLTVTATNATHISVTGSDGSSYTVSPPGGTQSVSPSATTTYTATATGLGGASATATATVTVGAAANPPTVTLSANPTSVAPGGSSVLTATATNATQVVITGTDGSRYTLSPTGGTQNVTPSSTTTYTATATGTTGGTATATAAVAVTANAATVTLSANPTSISPGGSSVLTATATNATKVVITGTDGSSYTLPATGGSHNVTPSATTTYTATATGVSGGAATATATVTVTGSPATVTLSANPTSISPGGSSVLTATATNATKVVITGTDGSSYTLSATGGTQNVTPSATTTYTATATGSSGGNATATAKVTVTADLQSIRHVIFMLQENHSFDQYFGMLNPYRLANNWNVGDDAKTYDVDGIDDKLSKISNQSDEGTSYSLFKLTSSCVEDETSSWLESYGDASRYDFTLGRSILMDGFVHTNENYAKNCQAAGKGCAGTFSDFTGRRAMGYYDQGFLNYYYYMASQFALSDRWFSPVSSKSIPNRIATFTGGTTQGLALDPGNDDGLPQLQIPTIFAKLTAANVSWKLYYTVTQGGCLDPDDCQSGGASATYPATNFSQLADSYTYLHSNPSGGACAAPTQPSSVVGDSSNSFCIDPTHIAPLSSYYTDLANGTLPSFAFIEAGYGINDEHPGSGQSILVGQQQVAKIVNALMTSSSWMNSVFFLAYDEGGGPYDHVPPVPTHSNDYTDSMVGDISVASIPDIGTIAVNPDTYYPCVPPGGTPTQHCDLRPSQPGANVNDAPAKLGFAAQLGFRVPNMVISPYVRKHYVSHIPMDHTAILKFVQNRFLGASEHLTERDKAQPDLTDFFDFTATPWATPPTPPTPVSDNTLGYNSCTPTNFGP
ncbi:alkaline phosphatase family protein [Terriglobus albidus]|uniref:alkaline phosphatase family protein n=1 Tax=Terriglobus albidus TaxID=1592106 RepID=UPI0021E00C28|nr:alkaline phosphatase family protein [Terriglobus albidus]